MTEKKTVVEINVRPVSTETISSLSEYDKQSKWNVHHLTALNNIL
ncbi:hypothetical protein AAEO50_18015 [Rossellomorea oryzaecorticis]|uniref:Uncharacterized protein n=1 Tax=Rossellomorea oryzaecorticis TaxID=1396505 RepID=A0ABU9KDJ3_9BACI